MGEDVRVCVWQMLLREGLRRMREQREPFDGLMVALVLAWEERLSATQMLWLAEAFEEAAREMQGKDRSKASAGDGDRKERSGND